MDDALDQIRDLTEDTTVRFVSAELWDRYGEAKGLSKKDGDYFQRLLLLLESDSEIDCTCQRKWSLRQVVAGIAVPGLVSCVAWVGFGWQILGVFLVFEPVSMSLAYWDWLTRSAAQGAEDCHYLDNAH